MQFVYSFDDDEVPRDAADEASVRFWDDEPGHASSERTVLSWRTREGRDQTVTVRRRINGKDALDLMQALSWTSESDEITVGDLWIRWW